MFEIPPFKLKREYLMVFTNWNNEHISNCWYCKLNHFCSDMVSLLHLKKIKSVIKSACGIVF